MGRELRILFVEDSPADAVLAQRELRKGGLVFEARAADAREPFLRHLDEFHPDLVLSDYSMPSFNGLEALKLLRDRSAETPFIFVSGCIGEDRAIEALKLGATDYVLKDRLTRLVPVVRRALDEVAARSERKRLEEQFWHAQKMEAIGRLAGGVAHDFNNLMTVIAGYAQRAIERAGSDRELREDVEEIVRASDQAVSLTRQLLAFSRRQVLQPSVIDPNDVVERTSRMLRRLIGEDVELVLRLAPDAGTVECDPGQLEQIVMNLAINARDAMPGGGRLTIATAAVPEGAAPDEIGGGPHALLSVTDTGTGMDAATRARIFEPFFTTKERGKGTGLGLSTVHGIVEQSGGRVTVESEPGRGSTFRVWLPRAGEPQLVAAEREPPARAGSRATGAVLIVEDERGVRDLFRIVLESSGLRVRATGDPEEACGICEDEDETIDLLLTDVVMPRMSGVELARRAVAARPGLRVVFMSGYRDDDVAEAAELLPRASFVEKPILPDALLAKIREALA